MVQMTFLLLEQGECTGLDMEMSSLLQWNNLSGNLSIIKQLFS